MSASVLVLLTDLIQLDKQQAVSVFSICFVLLIPLTHQTSISVATDCN